MSYAGAAEMDIPMATLARSTLIEDLMSEVTANATTEDQMSDIDAKILDEAPDHSDDDRDAVVPGVDGYLGQRIFNVGKYQKQGALMTFKQAYEGDKKYVAWVRKFIKGRSVSPSKTNHPTMTQFRLYIAIRDQAKSQRIMLNPRAATVTQGSSSQEPVLMPTRPKAEAAAKTAPRASSSTTVRQSSRQSQGPAPPQAPTTTWEDQWIVAQDPEAEETAQDRRRRLLRQRIEELTWQLEELEETADL